MIDFQLQSIQTTLEIVVSYHPPRKQVAFGLRVSFVDISSGIQFLEGTAQSLAADFSHTKTSLHTNMQNNHFTCK